MIENYFSKEGARDTAGVNEIAGVTELGTPGQIELLEEGVSLEHLHAGRGMETEGQRERIIGEPYEDRETWSPQAEENSCAVACQEMIAEQLTGQDFSEEEMIALARERGWYDPESGTTMSDVGKVLEEMGMTVERQTGATVNDLAAALEQGKVICGVNNMLLSAPELSVLPGLRANHAVQVTGIDTSDPNRVEVILNDPGVENGCGIRHSLDDFLKAWKTSSNFMVSVER